MQTDGATPPRTPRSATSPDDEFEVRRLSSLYAHALDANEPERLRDVFTADAVWRRGRDERRGLAVIEGIPGRLRSTYRGTVHQVTDVLIELEGDHGRMISYSVAHHLREDRDSVYAVTIRYRDTVTRTDVGWRITERELDTLWAEERGVIPDPRPRMTPP